MSFFVFCDAETERNHSGLQRFCHHTKNQIIKAKSEVVPVGHWVPYNPNPQGRAVGDCAIRALCKALLMSWEEVYTALSVEGYCRCDLLSANHVWGNYLYRNGFVRDLISDDPTEIYTVDDFARDHPKGIYVLAISGHVVCVWDGDYYDSWDSGAEIPIYYWHKPEEE